MGHHPGVLKPAGRHIEGPIASTSGGAFALTRPVAPARSMGRTARALSAAARVAATCQSGRGRWLVRRDAPGSPVRRQRGLPRLRPGEPLGFASNRPQVNRAHAADPVSDTWPRGVHLSTPCRCRAEGSSGGQPAPPITGLDPACARAHRAARGRARGCPRSDGKGPAARIAPARLRWLRCIHGLRDGCGSPRLVLGQVEAENRVSHNAPERGVGSGPVTVTTQGSILTRSAPPTKRSGIRRLN